MKRVRKKGRRVADEKIMASAVTSLVDLRLFTWSYIEVIRGLMQGYRGTAPLTHLARILIIATSLLR